jgi:hypothetical protein
MRWEDERYIRLYTRDTPEWLALSWQARGVLSLILRAVDRAGILKVGKLGLRGVAVAIRAPWVDVEAPLTELIEDGCVRFAPEVNAIYIPNFIEAQEACSSDAARKRASRERARAIMGGASASASESAVRALAETEPANSRLAEADFPQETATVTNRDDIESQNVSESHVQSHAVTRGHSVLCCAVPSQEENRDMSIGVSDTQPTAGPSDTADVRAVFEHWATKQAALTGVPTRRLKLTKDRRGKVRARLREGYSVDDLQRAVDGIFATDFNVEKGFTDLTLACRDAAHVDRYSATVAAEVAQSQTRLRAIPPAEPLFALGTDPPLAPEPTLDETLAAIERMGKVLP